MQSPLEGTEGAMLQRLNRPNGFTHDLANLNRRQILEEPKNQHLLLLNRQIAERLAQFLVRQLFHCNFGGIHRLGEHGVVERDQGDLAVTTIVIDRRVMRDPVNPGGESDPLVLKQVKAGEAAGQRVDGKILRILNSAKPCIDIVVDAVKVTLIKCAGRVLIAPTHPCDEKAIVIGRRPGRCAHWVTLSGAPGTSGLRARADWVDIWSPSNTRQRRAAICCRQT